MNRIINLHELVVTESFAAIRREKHNEKFPPEYFDVDKFTKNHFFFYSLFRSAADAYRITKAMAEKGFIDGSTLKWKKGKGRIGDFVRIIRYLDKNKFLKKRLKARNYKLIGKKAFHITGKIFKITENTVNNNISKWKKPAIEFGEPSPPHPFLFFKYQDKDYESRNSSSFIFIDKR